MIRIATKGSDIGIAKADVLKSRLEEAGHEVELFVLPDVGDNDNIGQQRLGLLRGDFDVAIQRMHRLPAGDAAGLVMAAITERDASQDCVAVRDGLELASLPEGARVATNSPLRRRQLNRLNPGLNIVDLRPDLSTCLDQVRDGELDAVCCNELDVSVLGREEEITERLTHVTAPGQGALGYECRATDSQLVELLSRYDHQDTRLCVLAELAVRDSIALADEVVLGARAARSGILTLRAVVTGADADDRPIAVQMGLPTSEFHAVRIGQRLAQALQDRGAERLGRPAPPPAATPEQRIHPTKVTEARVLLAREEGAMAVGLREAGITVDSVPLQQRVVLDTSTTLHNADWVAFTSVRAVESVAELGLRVPERARIAAVGPGTVAALEALGHTVDLAPAEGAGVAALIEAWPPGDGTVLVPGSALLAPGFVSALGRLGYDAQLVPVYTMQTLPAAPAEAKQAWDDGLYDVIIITSGSNALAVGSLLGWRRDVQVVAVGESAARVLARAGVRVAARNDSFLVSDVVDLLSRALASRTN